MCVMSVCHSMSCDGLCWNSRLQERMALGRSAAAADDGGIDGLATYKAQKAAAARLCTTRSLPTLPEGVKIRDDVMTKTKAFIAKLPDLA